MLTWTQKKEEEEEEKEGRFKRGNVCLLIIVCVGVGRVHKPARRKPEASSESEMTF